MNKETQKIITEAYYFAKKFIDKVDSGKAKSKETYFDMKKLIIMIDNKFNHE